MAKRSNPSFGDASRASYGVTDGDLDTENGKMGNADIFQGATEFDMRQRGGVKTITAMWALGFIQTPQRIGAREISVTELGTNKVNRILNRQMYDFIYRKSKRSRPRRHSGGEECEM